jgi:hypothetical protein
MKNLMFVGTSLGFVLKYDISDFTEKSKVINFYKKEKELLAKGAVVSLDVSNDLKVVVIGYYKGEIDLFNVQT